MKQSLILGSLLSGLVLATSSVYGASVNNFNASVSAYAAGGGSSSLVYNNAGPNNVAVYTGNPYGDEIVLGGTDRAVSQIKFEYYANYAQAGGITFNLWSKDAGVAPGASIYSATADIVNGGGIVSIDFTYDAGNTLPDRLVFTAQFAGVGGANKAGLILGGGDPSVGASADDYWEKTGPGAADWTLKNVPEPSTVALFSVAGLAFAGMMFFRRSK